MVSDKRNPFNFNDLKWNILCRPGKAIEEAIKFLSAISVSNGATLRSHSKKFREKLKEIDDEINLREIGYYRNTSIQSKWWRCKLRRLFHRIMLDTYQLDSLSYNGFH